MFTHHKSLRTSLTGHDKNDHFFENEDWSTWALCALAFVKLGSWFFLLHQKAVYLIISLLIDLFVCLFPPMGWRCWSAAVNPNFEREKKKGGMKALPFWLLPSFLLISKFHLSEGSGDIYLHIISLSSSLLADLCIVAWEFCRIASFGNTEIVINREK